MDYQAYILAPHGKVDNLVILECTNDAEALKLAEKLIDGHDVQLWQLDRLLGTFSARPSTKP